MLATFWACGGDSLTAELFSQQNETTAAECECFFAEEGYSSARECRDEETFTVPRQAVSCADRALSADRSGEVRAALECTVAAGAARLDCVRMAACDETLIDACDDDYFTAILACPEPSADAQAAVDAAVQDCIRGNVPGGPQVSGCPEGDLGQATGSSVRTGNNTGADNDLEGSCGGFDGNDVVLEWRAPSSGQVTINTTGSDFDTVLYVLEGGSCGGAELVCDDDGGDFLDSSVTIDVTAGEDLLIVVDAYSSDDSGDFVVNIDYL